MEIRATDAPPRDVTKILITVSDIQVNKAEGDAWQVVVQGPVEFDLVEIQGIETTLGEADLDPGQYNQVRLEVEQAEVTVDGNIVSAKVPSGKLRLAGGFSLDPGETTILTLDFDAGKSVVFAGTRNVIIKPVIKLLARKGNKGLTEATEVDGLETTSETTDVDSSDPTSAPIDSTSTAPILEPVAFEVGPCVTTLATQLPIEFEYRGTIPTGFDGINKATCTFTKPVVAVTVSLTGPAIHTEVFTLGDATKEVPFPLPDGTLSISTLEIVPPGEYQREITVTSVDGDTLAISDQPGVLKTVTILESQN